MKLVLLSVILAVFPICSFAQTSCEQGAYRYSAVSQNGGIDSTVLLTLRRNSDGLHKVVGQIPRDVETVYVSNGQWIMTLSAGSEVLINFTIFQPSTATFREDVLVAFLDGQLLYPRYEILGIELRDGYVRQLDLSQDASSPPEQILCTTGFRKIPEHFAGLKNGAGQEVTNWSFQFDALQAAILSSTGGWVLQPCRSE